MSAPTWQVEPLGLWGRPVTNPRTPSGRFRATWQQTLDELLDEIGHLDPTSTIAVRLDVEAGQIRRDGMLHARAKVGFPGVVVSFTSRDRGPLSFATDKYEETDYGPPGWQANIRAIALGLKALRAVDRYGMSSGREQYVGWRAIEGSGPASPFSTADSATHWLRTRLGAEGDVVPLDRVVLRARREWHPDRGGDHREDWELLDQAVQVLQNAGLIA